MIKTELTKKARDFATKAHEGQKRKYSGEPYIKHPIAVAKIVATVDHDEFMIAAAFLHDTVEDTEVTIEEILDIFGEEVAELVDGLTNKTVLADGNRAARKEMDRLRLQETSSKVHTIKTADLIHNSVSFMTEGGDFGKLWMDEKHELLKVLIKGNKKLHTKAKRFTI